MKNVWRVITGTIIAVSALSLASCSESDPSPPEFAVYMVDVYDDEFGELTAEGNPHARDIFLNMDQEYALAHSRIRKPPLLTGRDVAGYCWESHRLGLTSRGVAKWESAGGWEVPLHGVPVFVVVDGTTCYAAMIWNLLSSSSTHLPQFYSPALEGVLVTGCCPCAVGEVAPPDVRGDDRVREYLERSGKLVETCGGR